MLAYLSGKWLNRDVVNEFEFEIKQDEPLPLETRMELPEMSYEQELLNTPVPFVNRVEFLSDYEKFDKRPQTPEEIASQLGRSVHEVMLHAKNLGAEYDKVSNTLQCYAKEVIQEELEWNDSFLELSEYLSSKSIGKYLARSERWVERTANGLGVYPIYKDMSSGRKAFAYPKETAWMLRTVMLHFPPANDMYAISEVERLTGKDRDWIVKVIIDEELPTSLRMSAVNHIVAIHMTKEVVDILIQYEKELPEAAGGWLTEYRMAQLLGRDIKWVQARTVEYRNQAKYLLDDTHKPSLHYSPEVFEILKELNTRNREVLLASSMLSEKALAHKIGRSVLWVRNRFEYIEPFSEIRRNQHGREYRYYQEEAVAILERLESRQPKKTTRD